MPETNRTDEQRRLDDAKLGVYWRREPAYKAPDTSIFDPELVKMIRESIKELIQYEICDVQPPLRS